MEELGAPPFEVEIVEPSKASIDIVRSSAMETGDDVRLSSADLDLLALAVDMEGQLFTEDFSIQNVAEVMSVRWSSVGKPIAEVRKWRYR